MNPFFMKLYIATPSPFARKARVTLLEKQIPHEVVIENPWQPESKVKDLNPLAKIPTLVSDAVVMTFLENQRPEGSRSQFWLSRQADKIREGVQELERQLLPTGSFTALDIGLGEIATGSALGYLDLRYPSYDWRNDAPSLRKLFDRLMGRTSFQQTVPSAQELPVNQ